jgi:hypothetical protein
MDDGVDIAGQFEQLVTDTFGGHALLTPADLDAAQRLPEVNGGIHVLAVVPCWSKWCHWMILRGHASFPPWSPSLVFLYEHCHQAAAFIAEEGLLNFQPKPLNDPPGKTIDADGRAVFRPVAV